MATKAATATFEGHGLRITIALDSTDTTPRLVAIEACRRVAHQMAMWSNTREKLATATERAMSLAESDLDLRPAVKAGVATIFAQGAPCPRIGAPEHHKHCTDCRRGRVK